MPLPPPAAPPRCIGVHNASAVQTSADCEGMIAIGEWIPDTFPLIFYLVKFLQITNYAVSRSQGSQLLR